jgi:peptide/nickel transport system substrate-binding protein
VWQINRADWGVTAALAVVILLLVGFYSWQWASAPQPPPPPTAEPAPATPAAAASPPLAQAAPLTLPAPISPALPAAPGESFVQAVVSDTAFFNSVLTADPTAEQVAALIYPRLVGQDPNGGFPVPSELAKGWEFSPDGRTITFTLRSTLIWSDGRPVTGADVQFTYAALAHPEIASPFRDQAAEIESIQSAGQTVVIRLRQADCSVLQSLRRPLLPSHRYAADLSDLRTNPLNAGPVVGAGPFLFRERVPGRQIVLVRNPTYWKGPPHLAAWVLRVLPDAASRRQALQTGGVDLVHFDPVEMVQGELPGGPALTLYPYRADAYSVLALNLADPANPQPGQDTGGVRLAQAPHPILGQREVRLALAETLDIDRLLAELFQGRGYRQTGYVLPTVGWAYAELLPLAHDPAQAAARLEAAGWRDADGDGVRSAGGTPLRLTLQTNRDNALRVRFAEAIAAQLRPAGFAVDVQTVRFDELAAALVGQRFDLAIAGWENIGADPARSPFWHSREDRPGEGYNFSSFQDAEVDGWLDAAQTTPGCALAARGALYRQVQQRLAVELPAIFLAGPMAAWGYSTRWQGIAPGPWGLAYNVQEWVPR